MQFVPFTGSQKTLWQSLERLRGEVVSSVTFSVCILINKKKKIWKCRYKIIKCYYGSCRVLSVSTKIEKEKREHAKQHGMIRTEITGAEIAEEMEKERRIFQLQMCEVSMKNNHRFPNK